MNSIKEITYHPSLSCDDINIIHDMLESISIPIKSGISSRRGFNYHRAFAFGIIKQRFGRKVTNSRFDSLYPELYKELKHLANRYGNFTSIYVNHNVVCPKHIDTLNIGESVIVSFGDYTNCNLCININGTTHTVDTNLQPVQFDASKYEHWNTTDLTGNKYSIVFYNSKYAF